MFVNGSNSCFITLKDHKPNFLNSPKVHLLNPVKNELGKSILDRINTSLRNVIKVNQWKDTSEVIEWFKNIENKQIRLLKCWKSRNFYYMFYVHVIWSFIFVIYFIFMLYVLLYIYLYLLYIYMYIICFFKFVIYFYFHIIWF